MSKTKYRFNPETLRYESVNVSLKDFLKQQIPKVLGIMVVSFALFLWLSDLIETPNERSLRLENEQLKLQYKMLNLRLGEMSKALDEIKKRDNQIYRMIFEAEPVPEEMYKGGYGGINRYSNLEGLSNAQLVIETSEKLDELLNNYYILSKSLDEIVDLATYKKEFLESVPSISPLSDRNLTRFASGFGYRLHPIYKTRRMHTGIDLTAPVGTPVYATGKGTVVYAGSSLEGYGLVVIIDHGFDYSSIYAHLDEIKVKKNQQVKRGDIIGTVGSTGRSVAPHLHYEVRYMDKPVNPVNYYFNDVTPEEYERIIEISSRPTQSLD